MPVKKGKKKAKGKSKSKREDSPVKKRDPMAPDVIPPIPRPMENLLKVLLSHEVSERELHGMKVSIRALEELTPQEVRDLKVVFDIFDEDSDGLIGPVELKRAMKALGFKIRRAEARDLITDSSVSGKAQADFNEFLDVVISRQADGRDVHGEIVKTFELFDLDKTGCISLENLKDAVKETGLNVPEAELREMINEADLDGDSEIDLEEFIRVMLKTNLFD